jgi:hypothetical protein
VGYPYAPYITIVAPPRYTAAQKLFVHMVFRVYFYLIQIHRKILLYIKDNTITHTSTFTLIEISEIQIRK